MNEGSLKSLGIPLVWRSDGGEEWKRKQGNSREFTDYDKKFLLPGRRNGQGL